MWRPALLGRCNAARSRNHTETLQGCCVVLAGQNKKDAECAGKKETVITYLLSAIPANALYQARKAAIIPKPPPACVSLWAISVVPLLAANSPQASIRKAKSRVKNSMKNMTVDRKVHKSKMVVNMNQPVRKKPTADAPIFGSIAVAAWVA